MLIVFFEEHSFYACIPKVWPKTWGEDQRHVIPSIYAADVQYCLIK